MQWQKRTHHQTSTSIDKLPTTIESKQEEQEIVVAMSVATATSSDTQHTSYSPSSVTNFFKQTPDLHLFKQKILGDVLVATSVTFAVSPFLVVIDKAIVQRAAGTHTIVASARHSLSNLLRGPGQFVKSPAFLMMWGVYGATYTAANVIRTCTEHPWGSSSSSGIKSGGGASSGKTVLFVGSTAVNSLTSMIKDRAYATMFGSSGAAMKVPLVTYGLWGLRDCMVIGSSFVLPDVVGPFIQQNMNMNSTDATRVAQFVCPVVTQLFASPVQLLGLDFYNRPLNDINFGQSIIARTKFVAENFISIFGARVARIAPGYGIGGIGNTYFRDAWRSTIMEREIQRTFLSNNHGAKAEVKDGGIINKKAHTNNDEKLRAKKLVKLVVEKEEVEQERKSYYAQRLNGSMDFWKR